MWDSQGVRIVQVRGKEVNGRTSCSPRRLRSLLCFSKQRSTVALTLAAELPDRWCTSTVHYGSRGLLRFQVRISGRGLVPDSSLRIVTRDKHKDESEGETNTYSPRNWLNFRFCPTKQMPMLSSRCAVGRLAVSAICLTSGLVSSPSGKRARSKPFSGIADR